MSSRLAENKAVLRRHLEAMNEQDREGFADCFAADALPHGMDLDEFIDAEFAWFDAFPDLHYVIHDVFGEGDRVALHWTFEGTHEKEGGPGVIGAVEPTDEEIEIEGINIARVEDGQIVEYTGAWKVDILLDAFGPIDSPE